MTVTVDHGPVFKGQQYDSATDTFSYSGYDWPLWEYYRNRTDTVRRKKPLPSDLFAAATDFSVWDYYWRSSSAIHPDHPGVNLDYSTYPTQLLFPINTSYEGLDGFADLRSRADGKMRAKIKDEKLNFAQDVAEYRQTCSSFGELASSVVSGFRSLRSGRSYSSFLNWVNTSKDYKAKQLANRWLEIQFGFKPLLQDIYASAEVMAVKVNEGIPIRCGVRCHDISQTLTPKESYEWRYTTFHREETWVQLYAQYIVQNSDVKSLSQSGLANPFELAWELIPYSFVVDWAFNVGQVIGSLDALNGIKNLQFAYAGRKTVYRRNRYNYANKEEDPHDFKSDYRFHTAIGNNYIPLPNLRYKPSKSLLSVVNGLALLTQLRGR